jgi:hypothetical protein
MSGKRFFAILFLIASVLALEAGVVRKGNWFAVDALLSEGFETEAWQITWTTVDADQSGTDWQRLSSEDWYEPRNGEWSLGCRFNSDGQANDDWLISPPMRVDSLRREFSIDYKSQDPNYLESVEFLVLEQSSPIGRDSLQNSLSTFSLVESMDAVPTTWQTFTHDCGSDTTAVWYIAVRCVSQDQFVLLVDHARGLWTLPTETSYLEDAYSRVDFGLQPLDSTVIRSMRCWNLSDESSEDSLALVVEHRPATPFLLPFDVGDTLWVQPEDSLGFLVGFSPLTEDTVAFTGFYVDSLVFHAQHQSGSDEHWSIPFTGAAWDEESLGEFAHTQFFENPVDSLRWDGWTAELDASAGTDCFTDTTRWALDEFVSSLNYTVPSRSHFAFVNSDARGAFLPDGTPAEQCTRLFSPWIQMPDSLDGEPLGGLMLGYSMYFKDESGGQLQLQVDRGEGWEFCEFPEPSQSHWEQRWFDMSSFATADSLRIGFHFYGNWSMGAAVDDILLLPVPEGLSGVAPPSPQAPQEVEAEISVFPNPFNPTTTLQYYSPHSGRLHLRVFNVLGQLVIEQNPILLRRGQNHVPLDFSASAAGIYVLSIDVQFTNGSSQRSVRKVSFLK